MISIKEFAEVLQLEVIHEGSKPDMHISTSDLNRPGLQFTGYFDYFAYERPQVVGKVEMTYLEQMEGEARKKLLEEFFSYNMPCVIVCRNMELPADFVKAARDRDIPLFRSRMVTTKLTHNAINFLNDELAPRVNRHGVLMDVYGLGILITGESGIGKSECALELVKRGHMLVADDVVDIKRVADDRLVGEAPEMVRHFMEIRGIGLIDIRTMYGIGSVMLRKSIDMVIHLEHWDKDKDYDRLGLGEDFVTILGVKKTKLTLPVRPGRNLAIILEVAARNQRLKLMGYDAARELLSGRMGLI